MPVTVFSKRDCPLVWKLVEYTFNRQTYIYKDVRCERSKQTVNANLDSIAEITYFEINRVYTYAKQIQQADNMQKKFTFDKSSSIIYQKLRNSNGNTFSFIPHVCCFSYDPSIAAFEARSLTTLFSTKMRRKETQSQEHRHPSFKFVVETIRHYYCMLVKPFI